MSDLFEIELIPAGLQSLAWKSALFLIGSGFTIILWGGKEAVKNIWTRFKKVEDDTVYLMKENQLSKEMIEFYEKEGNSRRFAERRVRERRK